jgi:hypothetical protein
VRGETMICGLNDLLFAFAVSINILQDELKVGLKNAMRKISRQSMSEQTVNVQEGGK